MRKAMKKTIGILGGMGPEATAYMFKLILSCTKAEKDQDHIPVIIYSDPQVPARTDAILKTGPSPVPYLVKGIKALNKVGADFIIIPCVTVHHFIPETEKQIKFRYLSLVEETLKWIQKNVPELKTAGLIASTGTLKSGLFHNAFAGAGIDLLTPGEEEQMRVMEVIFGLQGVKAGFIDGPCRERIVDTARSLVERGAEAVIAGCTEIPLVLKGKDISAPLIEPMRIIAQASIIEAGYSLR